MAYCVGTVKTAKDLEAFIETVDDTKFLQVVPLGKDNMEFLVITKT